jgi:hypothetical protein
MSAPVSARGEGQTEGQHHRVFVITGANTGVGFETAKQLAVGDTRGERHIILACRTPAKADAAVASIRAALPEGREGTVVDSMTLDLVDLASIDAFVADFRKRNLPLHVLINNGPSHRLPDTVTCACATNTLLVRAVWLLFLCASWGELRTEVCSAAAGRGSISCQLLGALRSDKAAVTAAGG